MTIPHRASVALRQNSDGARSPAVIGDGERAERPDGESVGPPWPPGTLDVDPLTPEHRYQLEVESAIPVDVIAEEDIRSRRGSSELAAPRAELRHPDPEKGRRFGAWPRDLGPGIDFGDQYKPDCPRTVTSKDGKTRTVKYETPIGSRPSIYIPKRTRPLLKNRLIPLRIVEGGKKALSNVGDWLPTIAISGVDAWCMNVDGISVPLPEWDEIELDGRMMLIEYDSDAADKKSVQGAEARLADFLRERGATPVVVRLPHGPNGEKQGVDDFRAAGGSLRELENAAIIAAINGSSTSGSNGTATCDGNCSTGQALREQVREYKAKEEFRRHGPFSPAETEEIAHLVELADVARSNGTPKIALLREDEAEKTKTNVKAISRAWNAYKLYQDDPDLARTLPFRLEWRREEGSLKSHVDLYPVITEEPRTRAQELLALSRLPRERSKPGGDQRGKQRPPGACMRCDSPMARTTQDRCINDDCGNVVAYPTRIIGRSPQDPGQNVPASSVITIDDAPFTVETLPLSEPGQNVPHKYRRENPGQNVPAALTSFVSREDQEWADDPHHQALPPPEDPPALLTAPSHHVAYWARTASHNGGLE